MTTTATSPSRSAAGTAGKDAEAVGGGTALSVDGRQFSCEVPIGAALYSGSFVSIRLRSGAEQFGQVEEVQVADGGMLRGTGRVLGRLSADRRQLDPRGTEPFADAELRAADPATVDVLYTGARGTVPIGTFRLAGTADAGGEVTARMLAARFNRHTFWCGQSGSGKTYALGVVLEQLLVHTRLPMVIFDPNGDFVRLPDVITADAPDGRALASRDIRVLRPSSPLDDPLRVRFVDMDLPARAALLRLHPLDDREEYRVLVRLEETMGALDAENVVPSLVGREGNGEHALAARIENLRLLEWTVWAGESEAATDVLEARPDATVLDVGGFDYPDEPLVVALAVLDDLWAKREQRRPILIVIDEAHNLCSPEGTSPLQVAVRDRLIQIAAEGRKFGLWLLLSTQRPSRIHPSIISQCDNLALMKMTSPADLDNLATVFGSIPPAMINQAARFTQGEALFAGGFVPAPSMVWMGKRLTREGGVDITVPLRDG